MDTTNIKEKFDEADKKMEHVSNAFSGDTKLSTAIYQGLKLIAIAIIYHAKGESK